MTNKTLQILQFFRIVESLDTVINSRTRVLEVNLKLMLLLLDAPESLFNYTQNLCAATSPDHSHLTTLLSQTKTTDCICPFRFCTLTFNIHDDYVSLLGFMNLV